MSGNNQDGKGKVEKPLLMLKHICPWIQMDKVPDLGFQLEKGNFIWKHYKRTLS